METEAEFLTLDHKVLAKFASIPSSELREARRKLEAIREQFVEHIILICESSSGDIDFTTKKENLNNRDEERFYKSCNVATS